MSDRGVPRCVAHGAPLVRISDAPLVRISDGFFNVYECNCRERIEDAAKRMTPPQPEPAARDEDRVWLVWSNEHAAWWGANHCGYYMDIDSAGRYTLAEALAIQTGARDGWDPNGGTNPPEIVTPAPEYAERHRSAIAAARRETVEVEARIAEVVRTECVRVVRSILRNIPGVKATARELLALDLAALLRTAAAAGGEVGA